MRERYIAMLAGRGLKIGDKVVCTYRAPFPNQWWTAPFWVGVIEDVEQPDDDTKPSEARTCAIWQYVRVRYLGTAPGQFGDRFGGFYQLDTLAHLLPLHWSEDLEYSPYFDSTEDGHQALVEFAAKCGLRDHYQHQRTGEPTTI